ncbi:D-beta-hydroxybutyrate dehydrogenase-like isoform X1 [Biomphalaria glabrata]|uniref:3-oxoacyl-[acyl-carrier-protein] reductase n=1 Tax=Biomphalaria glabrata TaxID=6526 RepID=A0A9U8E858_BIOGL|nr:D-beta-hydroxybutyrate dehydrogenase-like isoform X1 [Biomphalaria glabrata]KAI8738261.1 D-beta-hydroxybutyrate dehydrogenase [Biomphalaria glabrata]KAI8782438.1 D-beta-hydroxybutyrate dehydrogenase [Biomphalaria glabrata]
MGIQRQLLSFLSGRTALITGSTSGIGEGVAKALASRGANIVFNGFGDENEIKKLVDNVQKDYNVQTTFIGGDLTKEKDVQALYDNALSKFPGGIDILVNNAGFQNVSPLENFPLDVFNKMVAVMLTAPFHLTKLCVGNMKQKGWGRIINIASVHGHVASPNKTAYVAIKHGIIGFTKAVAIETAGTGVTCTAMCPGYVETPLFIKQAEDIAKKIGGTYDDGKKQILRVHPTGEPVKVDEVSECVAFLCSQAASQMTGSSLIVDGGWVSH